MRSQDGDEMILDAEHSALITAEESCSGGVCTLPATQHLQIRVRLSKCISIWKW